MWDWLNKLFQKGQAKEGAKSEVDGGGPGKPPPVDFSEPRKLSPVDSPTILARLKTLGVLDHMDPNQEQALKRIVLTHCREGRTEMWWWSLCEFVRTRKTHRGELPFQVVDTRCETGRSFKERLIALEELFRAEGLQFRKIRKADGAVLHDRDPMEDGAYTVAYQVGDRQGEIVAAVAEGGLDVPSLVAALNGVARSKRWGYRLLLLPPEKTSYCVMKCAVGTAERAVHSRWGAVPYPAEA